MNFNPSQTIILISAIFQCEILVRLPETTKNNHPQQKKITNLMDTDSEKQS